MFFDDNNEAINCIEKMLNYPTFKKVKTNIAISYPVDSINDTPKEEEKVSKKEEKIIEKSDTDIIDELTKRFREIADEEAKLFSVANKESDVVISKLPETNEEKKSATKDEDDCSIEEKVKAIVQDLTDEDDDDDDEWDDDAKIYDQLRKFIENEFMGAFLWFMENSYERVSFTHQHKRRVYKIYKEITNGGNIYGKCYVDDSEFPGFCTFYIKGSKKAITNFNNNKCAKYAKILAKYIIASNTAPFVMDLIDSLNGCSECLDVVPSICGTRPVYDSEMYTKVLEKVCFGRDF